MPPFVICIETFQLRSTLNHPVFRLADSVPRHQYTQTPCVICNDEFSEIKRVIYVKCSADNFMLYILEIYSFTGVYDLEKMSSRNDLNENAKQNTAVHRHTSVLRPRIVFNTIKRYT